MKNHSWISKLHSPFWKSGSPSAKLRASPAVAVLKRAMSLSYVSSRGHTHG